MRLWFAVYLKKNHLHLMFVLTLSKFVNMQKLFFIASFFVAAFQVKAQNADSIFIKKLADEILTNGKAYENLRHLTK